MRKEPIKYTESDLNVSLRRFWQIIVCCFAIFAVPLLVSVFYMDHRLDKFEDSLSYRFPQQSAEVDIDSGHDMQTLNASYGQVIYVPAYSHVYHQDGKPHLLTITLSVRNTSSQHPIVLKSVRYFDTSGTQVKSYLEKPISISTLETVEFLVEREDHTGGSGANFIVEWGANHSVSEPIAEAVMIDTSDKQGISFARNGQVVHERVPTTENSAE